MACVVCFSSTQYASPAEADVDHNALLKQKLELFGIGANVKVKLSGGERMAGSISTLDDSGFTVASEAGVLSRPIRYDETSELTLVSKKHYRSETPDAAEVRRVIAALGIGKHVMVRTDTMKFHGQIRAIEPDHFIILPDDAQAPIAIAYQDVHQVGKNLGFLSAIGLVVVVIVVLVVIAKVK